MSAFPPYVPHHALPNLNQHHQALSAAAFMQPHHHLGQQGGGHHNPHHTSTTQQQMQQQMQHHMQQQQQQQHHHQNNQTHHHGHHSHGGGGGGGGGAHHTSPAPSAQSYRNLYVSGLPFGVDDDALVELFSPFGRIESAKVMIDVTTGQSRGFAFVFFGSLEEGCRAFGALSGKDVTVNGETFRMKLMPSEHDGRAAAVASEKIYVRNIPSAVPEDEIRAHFEQFGSVTAFSMRDIDAHLHHNKRGGGHGHNHQQRGVLSSPNITPNNNSSTMSATPPVEERLMLATIEYDSVDAARKAVEGTHNRRVFGQCQQPVLAKFADSQEHKDAKKAKKAANRPPPPPPPASNQGPHHQNQGAAAAMPAGVGGMAHPSILLAPPMHGHLGAHTAPSHGGGMHAIGGHLGMAPTAAGNAAAAAAFGLPASTAPALHNAAAASNLIAMMQSLPGTTPFSASAPGHGGHGHGGVLGASIDASTFSVVGGSSFVPQLLNAANYLPLPPRPGEHLVYFQGLLQKTADGQLIPARVDACCYADMGGAGNGQGGAPPNTTTTAAANNAANTATQQQQQQQWSLQPASLHHGGATANSLVAPTTVAATGIAANLLDAQGGGGLSCSVAGGAGDGNAFATSTGSELAT